MACDRWRSERATLCLFSAYAYAMANARIPGLFTFSFVLTQNSLTRHCGVKLKFALTIVMTNLMIVRLIMTGSCDDLPSFSKQNI